MKLLLALCLVVYLLAEVSAKPALQIKEIFENAKEKAQDAWEQAQEAASRALETAKNAMQNGFHSVQQSAQSQFGLGENSTQIVTEIGRQISAGA